MSDKPCLDSHVRVIENNEARVVVHWRYRLANTDHRWAYYDDKTGWGDIADWYYYIYPDGVVSKRMRCYSSRPDKWHEWDEQIVVLGEGQRPESVIKKVPVMTLVDKAGKAFDYDWNPDPPKPEYEWKDHSDDPPDRTVFSVYHPGIRQGRHLQRRTHVVLGVSLVEPLAHFADRIFRAECFLPGPRRPFFPFPFILALQRTTER